MGGGIGLMSGASHRVVTETTLMAMPEITIGLFPDVGGSYFLNQMPGATGLFLALTGLRLNAGDALFVGLADFFVENKNKNIFFEKLLKGSGKNYLLEQESQRKKWLENSPVKKNQNVIKGLVQGKSLREIYKGFEALKTDDPWLRAGQKTFLSGSPTSAALIFEQLRRGRELSLREVFQMELVLAVQCSRHHDFAEGVRALLVDKDQKPQWKPSTIEGVTGPWVEKHFSPPWKVNPLQNL